MSAKFPRGGGANPFPAIRLTHLLSADQQDYSSVICSDNVIDTWERFKSIFMSVVNNISPIKEVIIKHSPGPGITIPPYS